MDSILKINCLMNLSTILATLYFIARARYRMGIKKYIHNHFTMISIIATIVGVLSWYAFYYNCRALLLLNINSLNGSITDLFLFQSIINIPINMFVWYIFSKTKTNNNE